MLKTLRNETDGNSEFVEIIPVKKAPVFCKKPVSFQNNGKYIGKMEEISDKIPPKNLPKMTSNGLQIENLSTNS